MINRFQILPCPERVRRGVRHCFLPKEATRIAVFTCVSIHDIVLLSYVIAIVLNSIVPFSHGNHAWVSYQGFAESFNDTFTLGKEEGIRIKCVVLISLWMINLF